MIYQNYDDYERGRKAITYFHNAMATLYPSTYKISFEEMQNIIAQRKGGKNFVEGMGTGIILAEMSEAKVSDAMEELARQSKGKFPATNSVFTMALVNSSRQFSFIDMGKTVAVESAKDILKGTQKIGDSIIEAGKGVTNSLNLLKYALPIILIGGLGFYVYNRAK